jgi:NTP pyrophosphatase (non-canonical NTP hydrolase)
MFKNSKGEIAHCEEWTPSQWLQAVIGELGEFANLRKKVERGDFTLDDVRGSLGDELADVVIYIDILAAVLGINLGDAVMLKWNKTSEKVGVPMYVDAEDWHYTRNMSRNEVEEIERMKKLWFSKHEPQKR